MSPRNPVEAITPATAAEYAVQLADGKLPVLDLSRIDHGQGRHVDVSGLSVLAWWLLSTTHDASAWTVRIPEPGSTPFLPLLRSGLITAATLRGMTVLSSSGESLKASMEVLCGTEAQPRLPGADWAIFDDLAGGARLRIVPDLADPRRSPRPKPNEYEFSYPWLAKLGLASPAIEAVDYQRFIANADRVMWELIDNVHRWSRAEAAFAVVSTTRGSSRGGNWNRLHIIIADNGVGIPKALRADVMALQAVYDAGGDGSAMLGDMSDGDLVERLMRFAYGARKVAHHNGHGLNEAQRQAGRWVGAFDVVTTDTSGKVLRRGAFGTALAYERDDGLDFPGARGTVVHLLLQATGGEHREVAAHYEQSRFVEAGGRDARLSSSTAY